MVVQRSDSLLLPLINAGVVHLLMFVLLLTSFHSTNTELPLEIQVKSAPIIRATAISSAQVEKLVQQKKQRINAAAKAERDKKQRILRAAKKKKDAALAKKREKIAIDKQRQLNLEKQRQAEADKKAKAKAAKEVEEVLKEI